MQQQTIQGQKAQIIAECTNTTIYSLIQNTRSKLCSGVLKLTYLPDAKLYFFNLETFSQNIFPETPLVLRKTDQGITLIFPHIESGLCGLFLPQNEQTEKFLDYVQKIIQIIPFENAMQIPQFKDTIDFHCKNIQNTPLENEKDVTEYIQKGGETMKKGFTWIGGVLAEGINKGGEFISSKIENKDEVQISQESKEKVAKTKSSINQTVDATANFFKQVLTPVVEKASDLKKDINQQIDTSDNQTLKKGKVITVATWDALSQAFSGLGTALGTVGESIGTNTRQLVEKKYGQDITNTYLGGSSQNSQYQQIQSDEQL